MDMEKNINQVFQYLKANIQMARNGKEKEKNMIMMEIFYQNMNI